MEIKLFPFCTTLDEFKKKKFKVYERHESRMLVFVLILKNSLLYLFTLYNCWIHILQIFGLVNIASITWYLKGIASYKAFTQAYEFTPCKLQHIAWKQFL